MRVPERTVDKRPLGSPDWRSACYPTHSLNPLDWSRFSRVSFFLTPFFIPFIHFLPLPPPLPLPPRSPRARPLPDPAQSAVGSGSRARGGNPWSGSRPPLRGGRAVRYRCDACGSVGSDGVASAAVVAAVAWSACAEVAGRRREAALPQVERRYCRTSRRRPRAFGAGAGAGVPASWRARRACLHSTSVLR